MNDYHDWESIDEYLGSKQGAAVSGETFEGRNLWVYQVDNGAEKTIGVDCGRAGRDWVSISFCLELIEKLSEGNYNKTNWFVLPVINPDGYQYTITSDRNWNKNLQRTRLHYSRLDGLNRF